MSKLLFRLVAYWLPPLLWMSFIFYLSSQHKVSVTGTFTIDFIIFKSLHMIEYATLYFLLFRAFYSTVNKQVSINKKFLLSFFFTLIYAATDEFHQTFIPSRQGVLRDVFIDMGGVLLMFFYIKINFRWIKKLL